jgi:hypothetical protein
MHYRLSYSLIRKKGGSMELIEARKNGASYWKDIRGIDLYNNTNTKQED